MSIPLEEISKTIFKRSANFNQSDYANDIKSFNILFALDGKRSVEMIALQDAFDPEEFKARIKAFYDQGVIVPVMDDGISRGRAKKFLDAIILKRSRGVGAIAKTIKIKIALKGINPDALTPDTPDDPALLRKLVALAQSYGLRVKTKSASSKGKTKLIIDSIITQRSGGDPSVAKVIRTKFMLKGINPDVYSLDTPDDPGLVNKLRNLAAKMGVKIPSAKAGVGNQIEKML
jgi:nucleotide-binding universal stress UspA family protein